MPFQVEVDVRRGGCGLSSFLPAHQHVVGLRERRAFEIRGEDSNEQQNQREGHPDQEIVVLGQSNVRFIGSINLKGSDRHTIWVGLSMCVLSAPIPPFLQKAAKSLGTRNRGIVWQARVIFPGHVSGFLIYEIFRRPEDDHSTALLPTRSVRLID